MPERGPKEAQKRPNISPKEGSKRPKRGSKETRKRPKIGLKQATIFNILESLPKLVNGFFEKFRYLSKRC